jgi:hypothetical protein
MGVGILEGGDGADVGRVEGSGAGGLGLTVVPPSELWGCGGLMLPLGVVVAVGWAGGSVTDGVTPAGGVGGGEGVPRAAGALLLATR